MSATEYVKAGDTVPLETPPLYTSAGAAVTGSSNIRVDIRRDTDGYFLDFNDSTFKASGWTTRQATPSEVSSTNAPGAYRTTVDTTGWSAGHYVVRFSEVTTTSASNLPATGTLVVGGVHVASLAASSITATAIATDAIGAAQIAADAIGSSELAASAANEIADALLDRALSGHTTTGTAGEALSRLDAAVSTRLATSGYTAPPTVGDIADAVFDEALSGHGTSGSAGEAIGRLDVAVSTRLASASYSAAPSAATIADAVWDETASDHTTSGSTGEKVSRLDATISSRAATGAAMDLIDNAVDAGALAAAGIAAIQSGLATSSALTAVGTAVSALPSASSNASAVWSAVSRTLTGIGSSGIASQSSVDALPTAGGVADAVCDELLAGHTISGSVGEALGRLDVTLSTRLASSSYSAPPSASTIASQVWSTATPGAFSSGTAGYLVGTYLDAAVSSRLASGSYSAPPTASQVAAQVLGSAVPDGYASGSLGYVVGTNLDAAVSTRLASGSYSAAPSAATVADAVWDELLSGHTTSGSGGATLAAITAAPSASAVAAQVWATAEGTPTSGTFGYGLHLLRMGLTNRLEETAGNPGTLRLYADDGTTVAKSWQLRDAANGAVTAQTGAPAKRGAAT